MVKFDFSASDLAECHRRFSELREVTPFSHEPKFAALVASLGIVREIGTVNDELARFIFAPDSDAPVDRASLRAEMVTWRGSVGVRIWSAASAVLRVRARWLTQLLHPDFSFAANGEVQQLVFFPEALAKIAKREGVDLVLVRSWGMNSIFGGFDPAKGYYQTNFWELENNDALKFASLIQNDQLALLGTHDLIAHVAGLRAECWSVLKAQAKRVDAVIQSYFASVPRPSIAALILPYTAGVVLDDLAQPPTYNSVGHTAFLEELLSALEQRLIQPNLPTFLTTFPATFEVIIAASRAVHSAARLGDIRALVQKLVSEILAAAINVPAVGANFD